MRILAFAIPLLFVLLAAVSTSASAAPDCDESTTLDGGFVRLTVDYGVACANVGAQVCTLQTNPDYPSHPYWVCRTVV